METPSSARTSTRSQALAASGNTNNIPNSKKIESTEKGMSKSRQRTTNQQDRSALIDITNDSPIVGLAMGSLKTPSSNMSQKRVTNHQSITKNNETMISTPGSGEALLRGQVKTLLQKVEEEAEIFKFSFDHNNSKVGGAEGPFVRNLKGLLLAPTPNNTPHVSNLSVDETAAKNGLDSVNSSPLQENLTIDQMVTDIFEGEKKQESLITRSLLFDFTDKSDDSHDSSDCTSDLTYQGGSAGSKVKSCDNDDASIWSMQVNASTKDDEEEDDVEGEVEIEEDDDDYYDDYYDGEEDNEEYGDDDGLLDDLCEGLSKIDVNGVKFCGKHTRFVYNSDDEIEGEEDCGDANADSPSVLRLKGLPTPKGKHLRFPTED